MPIQRCGQSVSAQRRKPDTEIGLLMLGSTTAAGNCSRVNSPNSTDDMMARARNAARFSSAGQGLILVQFLLNLSCLCAPQNPTLPMNVSRMYSS